MHEITLVQKIVAWVLPVLFAITVHETAHGWMALRLGDKTAMMLGRLTLNPLKHIDPVGTILVPGLMLMLSGLMFGWAKPVPITWQNLGNPKRDMVLVAAAGPLANLLMAFFWAAAIRLGIMLGDIGIALIFMGAVGIFINTLLMALNMLPLPPLDGGRVLAGLLPGPLAYKFSRIEPYGFLILIVLLVTGILGKILIPIIWLVISLLAPVTGLQPRVFIEVLQLLGILGG
ncbi:MAG: site-2 protease family protein [Gammaproteobacteria bacterium]|nr:MAG: site-2 protease family protein [Gammaproteobacteria bacterium]UCC56895.1 MAG: site-2 protease family protein [Gammaproteobacteria bacterium]